MADLTAVPAERRFREEDPGTDEWAMWFPTRLVAGRSRFEIDLNRPRDSAVYGRGEDCWNVEPWHRPLPPEVVQRSLQVYDAFPLQCDGVYAAFRRVPSEGEARANMTAGASVEAAEVDDTMLHLAEIVGPRLAEDGMFLAGLDIVGDRILEINVFSPGGLGSVESLTGVDFNEIVVAALEQRVSATG